MSFKDLHSAFIIKKKSKKIFRRIKSERNTHTKKQNHNTIHCKLKYESYICITTSGLEYKKKKKYIKEKCLHNFCLRNFY